MKKKKEERKMERHTLPDAIQDAIDTFSEIKRMHQLNFELIEQLNVTCQWIVDSNISIPNKEHLQSLLCKTVSLINELRADEPKILQYNISRRKVTAHNRKDKTDEDETEPLRAMHGVHKKQLLVI